MRIIPVLPASDGSYNSFTPNSGTTHYNRVNQAQADDDTTYNAGTSGKDSYRTATAAGGGTIAAAQVVAVARKDDAGSHTARVIAKTGAGELAGPTVSVGDTYNFIGGIFATRPDGQPWTDADFQNSAEFGIEVMS